MMTRADRKGKYSDIMKQGKKPLKHLHHIMKILYVTFVLPIYDFLYILSAIYTKTITPVNV